VKFTVVIPNRYPDVIQPLLKSLKEFEGTANVVIIPNGHVEGYGYTPLPYPNEPFVYAKACNIGIKYALERDHDVVLLNDDCVLLGPTLDSLAILAYHFPDIGLLSPLIKGCVGNPLQRWYEKRGHWDQNGTELVKYVTGVQPVCFP
jgi:hypothetical protein